MHNQKHGFSLVELSIVLVILGLLTGGILAGQSLIRAAELRSVVSEYQRYVSAVQSFRDKYIALPGDMANATRFWGDDNAACADAAIPNGTPGTCNGNGNGLINNGGAANATAEWFQFWKQLALAGLIEGSYSGLSGAGGAYDGVIGTNIPRAKLSNAGWGTRELTNYAGDGYWYALDYGNYFTIGTTSSNNLPITAVFRPEEAWNIDTKLDDGKPAVGKIISNWSDTCTTSASQTVLTGDYALTSNTINCALHFRHAF